ncbi:MAG: DNA primase [Candidatus Hydrogenedentota bacterium]|nr:MAG: DNA primase [Candidatus Hydrogenedentota bacterium]
MSDVNRVLQAVPIESYIEKFVSLKKRGRSYVGLCPFHSEKTPSFHVSPEKGIFKCFGCGKGGNVITFVQEYENVSFPEALKILADYAGITLEGRKHTKSQYEWAYKINNAVSKLYASLLPGSPAESYLKQRGISLAVANRFRLGFAPNDYHRIENRLANKWPQGKEDFLRKCVELGLLVQAERKSTVYDRFRGRLIFPITDTNGRVVGFGGRVIDKDTQPKYMNSPESAIYHKKQLLYNLAHAKEFIRKNKEAILVEGYMDVIGLAAKSVENAVAPLGTSFTAEQAKLLKRYTDHVLIWFDSDNAGLKAAVRALPILTTAGIHCKVLVSDTQQKQDPFDIAMAHSSEDLKQFIAKHAKPESKFILWYYFHYLYSIEDLAQKRMALKDFFEFVSSLKHDWEKQDYIQKAATLLGVPAQSLQKDFQQDTQKKVIRQPSKQQVFSKGASRAEKDVLTLLLKYPSLWEEEELLKEMQWHHQDAYLLYSYFRDRIQAGEIWKFEDLFTIQLPKDLASLLSGILMETDTTNENDDVLAQLKSIIYNHKLLVLNKQIRATFEKLRKAEALGLSEADEIAKEHNRLLQERTKLQKLLQS